MRTLFVLLVLLGACLPLNADTYAADSNEDGEPDQWYEMLDGQVTEVRMDRNFDGTVDYRVRYDGQSRKVLEEMDFNFDGQMDDFSYYEEGRLAREEIDSNFDGRVDVWVTMEGMYIRRYEMDRDFDGKVDTVKDYEQQ
jgi:hypothetical protein